MDESGFSPAAHKNLPNNGNAVGSYFKKLKRRLFESPGWSSSLAAEAFHCEMLALFFEYCLLDHMVQVEYQEDSKVTP